MNRYLLVAFAAVSALAVGPATAADMAQPAYQAAPPPPPPALNWTGFYVGAGYSYGFWTADTTVFSGGAPMAAAGTTGGKGWLGLVNAGYDYQFSVATMNLVAGVFGDFDFGSMKGTFNSGTAVAPLPFNTLGGVEKETSYWAVGGRIGWLVTPQVLSYWNGGYTQAQFDGVNISGLGAGVVPPMSIPSNTYHGWFLGGGIEAQVTLLPIRGLFFNTEYRYSSYSASSLAVAGSTAAFGVPVSLNIHPYEQSVTSGLKYKFNWTQ